MKLEEALWVLTPLGAGGVYGGMDDRALRRYMVTVVISFAACCSQHLNRA